MFDLGLRFGELNLGFNLYTPSSSSQIWFVTLRSDWALAFLQVFFSSLRIVVFQPIVPYLFGQG
jgi:hypothetical protein